MKIQHFKFTQWPQVKFQGSASSPSKLYFHIQNCAYTAIVTLQHMQLDLGLSFSHNFSAAARNRGWFESVKGALRLCSDDDSGWESKAFCCQKSPTSQPMQSLQRSDA